MNQNKQQTGQKDTTKVQGDHGKASTPSKTGDKSKQASQKPADKPIESGALYNKR